MEKEKKRFVIRRVRTTRYVGITEAARGIGCSVSHLSMYLDGKRQLAKAKRVQLVITDETQERTVHNV